ncbi:MAG TPA: mannonate dehydratase [Polyangia bacterium]|nr:mannonate dehydratase [Polyangia bacterium]
MTRARFDRRRLFAGGLAAPLLLGRNTGGAASSTTGGPKVGCQEGPTTDEWLRFFARHGVRHICGVLPGKPEDAPYTVDELSALRDRCVKHGIALEMMTDPNLRPTPIDESRHPAIMLGTSPERDREIEKVQTLIRNCARAGIPAIRYNLTIIGYQRSGRTTGPGGASYTVWRLKDASVRRKQTRAGRVTADSFWERITYFLDRVIPVATEHKVRMACHPHDPPTPPGFQGVDSVLGTVEGLKKFVSIRESPYHGLNFCQGTIATMLADPPREIFDVIRWFGARKKIFNVHFRNIHGARDDFEERLPDTGDIDFVKAMRLYKELGYDGMMMPDHVPKSPDDPEERQALAYCYGYIKALIQSA